MKKSHRRRAHGRRILLCLLAVALLFVVLALRQNILLDTTSRHALLMDAQTGRCWRRNVPTKKWPRRP